MRKIYLVLCLFSLQLVSLAQLPQAINFQGVAVKKGKVLPDTALAVNLSIIDSAQGGKVVYEEFHGVKTNAFGSFSLQVGASKKPIGPQKFEDIDWQSGKKHMKIVIDLTADQSDPIDLGILEMVSVPFAFAAESVTNIHDKDAQKGDVLVFDGANWVPGDTIQHAHTTSVISQAQADTGNILQFDGSKWSARNRLNMVVKSQDYSIQSDDDIVLIDASKNSVTVTLPTAHKATDVLKVRVSEAGNAIWLKTSKKEDFVFPNNEFGDSIQLSGSGDYVELFSDGTSWQVLQRGAYVFVEARHTSSQSMTHNVYKKLNFNTEYEDTYKSFSNSTGTFTCPKGLGGLYQFNIHTNWGDHSDWDGGDQIFLYYKKDGTGYLLLTSKDILNGVDSEYGKKALNSSFSIYLSGGESVTLYGYQATGQNIPITESLLTITRTGH